MKYSLRMMSSKLLWFYIFLLICLYGLYGRLRISCLFIFFIFSFRMGSDKNAFYVYNNDILFQLCPFPSDEELQQGLQLSVDWNAFRKLTLDTSLKRLTQRRQMRNDLRGTKVMEAFSY